MHCRYVESDADMFVKKGIITNTSSYNIKGIFRHIIINKSEVSMKKGKRPEGKEGDL